MPVKEKADWTQVLTALVCNLVKMSKADKRIPVREETFEKLGDLKGAGDTWDDVMQELIEARQKQNRRELLERTEDDEFVPLDEV
ncbi:MAG: antitoxin VapB family protein [Halorientalis sp.]